MKLFYLCLIAKVRRKTVQDKKDCLMKKLFDRLGDVLAEQVFIEDNMEAWWCQLCEKKRYCVTFRDITDHFTKTRYHRN